LTEKIAKKTGEGSFLLLVFIYLISIFSYFVGGYQANKQEYFLTSEAKPNYVLIRKYGNEWLALKVDEKSQVFSQTYELIPTNMINAFSSTNVGKLKAWQEDSLND